MRKNICACKTDKGVAMIFCLCYTVERGGDYEGLSRVAKKFLGLLGYHTAQCGRCKEYCFHAYCVSKTLGDWI